MNEQELQEHIIGLVLAFGAQWNEHEQYVHAQGKAQTAARSSFDSNEEKFAWLKANPQVDWFAEFGKRVTPLFAAYCTDKKRVYGGNAPGRMGFPAKYDGIENPVSTTVVLKNKNRAEVHIVTDTRFRDEYLFVLLYKAEQWRIDSYKGRRYGGEKWNLKIL